MKQALIKCQSKYLSWTQSSCLYQFSLIVITENSLRCNSVEVSVCVQDERLLHIQLRAVCEWSPRKLRHRMQQRKNFYI